METLRRWQTTAAHCNGLLSLPVTKGTRKSRVPLVSPYFQRSSLQKVGTGRDTNILVTMNVNAIFDELIITGGGLIFAAVAFFDLSDNYQTSQFLQIAASDVRTLGLQTAVLNAIATYATGASYTVVNNVGLPISIPPMLVGGVAKSGYYPVVGTATVAAGAGVARFYIDSNGDGTGTAPSEVESTSLQAVVLNTSNVFMPASITVDTNRKYIDITMYRLSFTSTLLSLINVLTGATLGAATNGTVVNCLVFVKQ